MAQAVQVIKRGRSGDPLVMRAENLKGLLLEASRETNPVNHWWRLLVRLIHKTFEERVVTEKVAWAMTVFLPKGRGGN